MQTIKLNWTTYDLKATTGTVVGHGKNIDTQVFGYTGTHNTPGNISSVSVVQNDIFLQDSNGKEHSFQLSNFNVACRDGHILTIIQAPKHGKKEGRYLAVINHSTDKQYYHKHSVKLLCVPNKILLGVIFVVGVLLDVIITGHYQLGFIGVFAFAIIAFHPIMEKINEKKLKEAINPDDYLKR